MTKAFQTPKQIAAAYENGLPGWQFDQETMDALMADRKATLFAEAAPHLAGAGKGQMALLWRSREKFDPGAFGQEAQTLGDCVSHGSRNARGARGHGGQGMDPAKATRFEADYGFLFRQEYSFVDLTRYDARIGDRWGSSGVPQAVREECGKHNVGQWIAPTTVDQIKDLLFAGYGLHSGQSFGVRPTSDARGIAVPSGAWSHDLATVGYDDTREVYPVCVFLVANSWGRWNQRPTVWPEDRYGPWPEGSFWLAEDVYARYFVGSQSIFAYADIKGVPQKKLPDYGNLKNVLG